MYSGIGWSQPGPLVVASLEVAGVAVVVIVIQSVLVACQRVAIDVRVVAGVEKSQTDAEIHPQIATAVQLARVSCAQASSAAFALPALCLAKADAVFHAVDIYPQVGTSECPLALEVPTHLQAQVADLEKLLLAPAAMLYEGEPDVICQVPALGVVFYLDISARCPSELRYDEQVVYQVGADSYKALALGRHGVLA